MQHLSLHVGTKEGEFAAVKMLKFPQIRKIYRMSPDCKKLQPKLQNHKIIGATHEDMKQSEL